MTGQIDRPVYARGNTLFRIPLVLDVSSPWESLRCEIPVDDATTDWVAALAAGDTVTVRGYIRGNMDLLKTLHLEECEPVAP